MHKMGKSVSNRHLLLKRLKNKIAESKYKVLQAFYFLFYIIISEEFFAKKKKLSFFVKNQEKKLQKNDHNCFL